MGTLSHSTPRTRAAALPVAVMLVGLAWGSARDARADDHSENQPGNGNGASAVGGPSSPAATAIAPPSESAPHAMKPEAQAHYERGLDRYAARDFAAAIRELEQGYAVDPRPELLFAEAQAFRLGGDCAHAVPLYERFLGSDPKPIQIEATRLALARCPLERAAPHASTSSQKTTAAGAPPARVANANADTGVSTGRSINADATPEKRAPRWMDPWALSALGAGVAALGVGTGFAIASAHARDTARSPNTMSYSAFSRLWDSAEQRHTIAIVSFATGGALVAAGVARLIVVGLRERADADHDRGVSRDVSRDVSRSTGQTSESDPDTRDTRADFGLAIFVLPGGAAAAWETTY